MHSQFETRSVAVWVRRHTKRFGPSSINAGRPETSDQSKERNTALGAALPLLKPSLPNVPTFVESGYRALVLHSWFGLSGPKKLSPDIVARINREARAFLKEPQMRRLAELDLIALLDSSEVP